MLSERKNIILFLCEQKFNNSLKISENETKQEQFAMISRYFANFMSEFRQNK